MVTSDRMDTDDMKERVDSAARVIKAASTRIYEAFTNPAAMVSWLAEFVEPAADS